MSRRFEIPEPAARTAHRQAGLLSARQCDDLGVSRQVRRRLVEQMRWQRPGRGVYDTDPVPVEHRRREDFHDHVRRRQTWLALLLYGPQAVATGPCALVLHDVDGLPVDFVAEVALPGGTDRANRCGVAVRQYGSFPMVLLGDRRVARLDHAVAQALPRLPRENMLAVLDDVARRSADREGVLPAIHELVRGRPGAAAVHEVFGLVDGRAESPAESFARLSCIDNGVLPDDIQVRFFVDGKIVARVDLAWWLPDGRWLVVEIDGVGPHSSRSALVHDSPRQNQLLASGRVVLLRFKPSDSRRPGGIGAAVAVVLQKHGWRPGRDVARDQAVVLELRQR